MNNCLKEFMAEHIRMPLLGYSAQGKTFSELSQDHQRIIRNKASFLTPETELADLVMPTEHLALRLNIREDLIVGAFDLPVATAFTSITEGKAEPFPQCWPLMVDCICISLPGIMSNQLTLKESTQTGSCKKHCCGRKLLQRQAEWLKCRGMLCCRPWDVKTDSALVIVNRALVWPFCRNRNCCHEQNCN